MSNEYQLEATLRDVEALCSFAFEHGFHEMGYDPAKAIRAFAELAVRELSAVEKEINVPSEALRLMVKGAWHG